MQDQSHQGLSDYARLLRSLSHGSDFQNGNELSTKANDMTSVAPSKSHYTGSNAPRLRDSGFANSIGSMSPPASTYSSLGSTRSNHSTLSSLSDENFPGHDSDMDEDEWYGSPPASGPPAAYNRAGRRPSVLSATVDNLLRQLDTSLGESGVAQTMRAYPTPSSSARSSMSTTPQRAVPPNLYIPTMPDQYSRQNSSNMPPLTAPLPRSISSASPPGSSQSVARGAEGSSFPFPGSSFPPSVTASASSTTATTRAGYIQKHSATMFAASWKKRYLVLDRGTLFLFRTHKSLQKDLTSLLKLTLESSVRVSENGLWVLEISGSADVLAGAQAGDEDDESVTSDETTESVAEKACKTWIIKCEGKDDMMDWLHAIRACIADAVTVNRARKLRQSQLPRPAATSSSPIPSPGNSVKSPTKKVTVQAAHAIMMSSPAGAFM
ncbi:hypothetical protein HKX48_002049 [Thoreauomyces humboldtii]|nr:hypothetical protein HKX48_002049 [Thoreauomyces humboldtii]